jgi:hypothetical protein
MAGRQLDLPGLPTCNRSPQLFQTLNLYGRPLCRRTPLGRARLDSSVESNVPGLNPPAFRRSASSRSGPTGCFELAEHVGIGVGRDD